MGCRNTLKSLCLCRAFGGKICAIKDNNRSHAIVHQHSNALHAVVDEPSIISQLQGRYGVLHIGVLILGKLHCASVGALVQPGIRINCHGHTREGTHVHIRGDGVECLQKSLNPHFD